RTELIAGLTTFLTMAYIVFVNPQILAAAGMDKGAVFVATCLAAAYGSLAMGLFANYPVALAPGMGLNAFFAFVVVKGLGLPFPAALAGVFVAGLVFLAVSATPAREWLINAIPKSQKLAIAAGIGFFLGIIALESAGIVVAHPATLVTSGKLDSWPVLLAAGGFFAMVALDRLGVPGAILLGILGVTAVGIAFAAPYPDGKTLTHFAGVFGLPPDPSPVFAKLDFAGLFALPATTLVIVLFSFFIVAFFDTAGTLVSTAHQAGMLGPDGRLPRLRRALLADSSAMALGAVVGTSTTTAYIESAAGIKAGGRTGLTAAAVGVFFLLALVFAPLAGSIPPYATAPAILFVACMMAAPLAELDWTDPTEYAPAVVTVIGMPLTYSIATGIGLGIITYIFVKFLSGRFSQLNPAVLLIGAVFVLHFAVA
ncbi:MAG: NCS2 family permease, partial [Rhodospirillaceae bacterium]|nr:NCS2 family permease [Rhodospirillaceae bacterium]